MPVDEIVFEAEEHMEKAVSYLRGEFRAIRTGRASPALLDSLKIDYYGAQASLKEVATVAAPEPSLLVIKPFDTSSIKDIEKAILASPLGLTPNTDGRVVRLAIPALSGERRQQLATQVKQMAEQGRVTIRNARRDANKQLDHEEKDKVLTEDDRDSGKKQVDDLTKKYVAKVDEILEAKTGEIMEV